MLLWSDTKKNKKKTVTIASKIANYCVNRKIVAPKEVQKHVKTDRHLFVPSIM